MPHNTQQNVRRYGHLALWFCLGVCVIMPCLLIMGAAFLSHDPLNILDTPFSLAAFRTATDGLYLRLMLQTVMTSLYVTWLCLLISYPCALALLQLPKPWQHIGLVAIMVPFWTSTLVRTYAILSLLQAKGWLSSLLLGTGLITEPLAINHGSTAVIIGLVYDLLPMMLLPIYMSLHSLDARLFEAARDLGVCTWRRFCYITLPLTTKGATLGCLLVFLPATSLFFVPDILGGAKGLMLGNLISDAFVSGSWPLGAALSLCFMLPLTALIMCGRLYRWKTQ